MNMNLNMNMDQFVNKLRNTVSQVAHQVNSSVNTIIPGNIIHREYEMLKLRCSHGCPGFVWSIYDAVKRDSPSLKGSLKDAIGPSIITADQTQTKHIQDNNSTCSPILDKQLYSVFVFDKNQLDSLASKSERELALDHVKRGVTQLTRLRHPSVLTIHHTLEESRSSLAFVTEHVFGHLESILKERRGDRVKRKSNVGGEAAKNLVDINQSSGPTDTDYRADVCELDDIQIKAGLLQVSDGLKFLQNAKLLHRNLCLDNIFVDSNNTWKIAGFDFATQQATESSHDTTSATIDTQICEFTGSSSSCLNQFPSLKTIYSKSALPNSIVPNWSCAAPEHSNSDKVSYAADTYSLGILTCALLGGDRDMIDLSYEYGLISDTYKRGLHIRELADKLPTNIKTSVMKFAAINVDSRPSLDDYNNLAIFNDKQVKTIRDLDAQFAWDRLSKIDFFNRLRDVLPQLSHQVRVNRVAKCLSNEIYNPDMVSHVLPCILIVAKDATPTEFKTRIFPLLKGPFRVLEPRSVPMMLLDNLAILGDRAKLCLQEFQQCAFTLVQYLLKMDQQLQEKSLETLPKVKQYMDNRSLVDLILPEINRLCQESTVPLIRVKCIECISHMVDVMEHSTIINQVLPILFALPAKDADVIMAATGAVKVIVNGTSLNPSKELIGNKLLPFLTPLSAADCLNIQQFESVMSLIRTLLERIERVQRETLSKKAQISNTSRHTGPMTLDNFKGSKHFQI